MSRSRTGSAKTADRNGRFDAIILLPVLIIAAGLAVYLNSFGGVFLFDDAVHILQNERIQQLRPLSDVLTGRRPVVDLSLVINHALGDFDVGGYHAVNVTVHIAAALVLYGIIRRTLMHEGLRERFGSAAPWLGLVSALLWVVHPLQTQSVTYLIQRAESMMGLFYLLALYCVIRAEDSRYRVSWYVVSIVCCGLGMGSKGVTVTAPLVVLLYDRVFLSRSLGEALRRRWFLYLGLAATWGVLWACGIVTGVLDPSRNRGTVGFSYKGITPLEYVFTQFGVLVQYLKLSFWPHPLCLDYKWPVARTAAQIIPQATVIAVLLAGVVWAWFRKPWLGFLGGWFLLILAPTSSFIPIKDTLFEHRMYLPLAAVIVAVVIGAYAILRRAAVVLSLTDSQLRIVATLLAGSAVIWLASGTVWRNEVYHEEVSMWRDVVFKRPHNARAFEQLGTAFVAKGNLHEAAGEYRRAVEIDPDFTSAHANLGNALTQTGQFAEAIRHYDRVRELDPHHLEARMNRGHALDMLGRIEESIEALREATRVNPRRASPAALARAHYNLGSAVGRQGDLHTATAEYREALRLRPDYEKAHFSLGLVLDRQGRLDEAIEHYKKTLELNPDHDQARRALDDATNRRQSMNPN